MKKIRIKITRNISWFLCSFLVFLSLDSGLMAAERNPSLHISFGQYRLTDGDDTVNGTSLTITYLQPFTEYLSFYGKISNGSASGTHVNDDDTETNIDSSYTAAGTGLQADIGFDDDNKYTFFFGGGLIVQSYKYNFDYSDSSTGETSGFGYGYTLYTGLKIRPTKNFVIIPGYQYEQVQIKSEEGNTRTITSAGTSLALAVSF